MTDRVYPIGRNTELRHLKLPERFRLSEILCVEQSWKHLMNSIPKDLNELQKDGWTPATNRDFKYTAHHVR